LLRLASSSPHCRTYPNKREEGVNRLISPEKFPKGENGVTAGLPLLVCPLAGSAGWISAPSQRDKERENGVTAD